MLKSGVVCVIVAAVVILVDCNTHFHPWYPCDGYPLCPVGIPLVPDSSIAPKCNDDKSKCASGQIVLRNPRDSCEFYPCRQSTRTTTTTKKPSSQRFFKNHVRSSKECVRIPNLETRADGVRPTYTDVKSLLLSIPDSSDGILKTNQLSFLTDVKNPCFALAARFINVGNITLSYALDREYEIRCLPYAYQAGFTKCGTNTVFFDIVRTRFIMGHSNEKNDWRFKEVNFWDNHNCIAKNTLDAYSEKYNPSLIIASHKKYHPAPLTNKDDDFRNMVFIDGTPRYVWHGDDWKSDKQNQGQSEPTVLLPHKLHHVQPQAKFIILLRNPSDRLFSDYKYYYTGEQTAHDFHNKVVHAIVWWKKCVEKHPLKACAYGQAPNGLPELSFMNCQQKNKTLPHLILQRIKHTPPQNSQSDANLKPKSKSIKLWEDDGDRISANRLRVSMYDVYISIWLELFPKSSMLFIRNEDYSRNRTEVISNDILPFLDLPPLTQAEKKTFDKLQAGNIRGNTTPNKIKILPETRAILDQFYLKTKKNLVKLLGDKKFMWEDINK